MTGNRTSAQTTEVRSTAATNRTLRWREHKEGLVFVLVGGLYLFITFLLASQKGLWNDELFTFYIARRPSLTDVWNVLLTGAEQLPPLFYIITRSANDMFGTGKLAFRLPEIAGFALMSLSLYWFVRRRLSPVYALVAMLFPMLTDAFRYAVEARPYALVLGFSSLALVCWQAGTEDRQPVLARLGVELSLACAVSCHYYAVFAFLPFVLGEGVRTWVRRKVDLGMWLAIVGGLVPLAIYLPLIRAAHAYSPTFWAKPNWTTLFAFFQDLLIPATLALLAIPLVVAFRSVARTSDRPLVEPLRRTLPAHELAAIVGFILIPVAALMLAETVTGAFAARYALPAVIGLSVAFSYSLWLIARRSTQAGLLVVAIMSMFLIVDAARDYRQLAAEARARGDLYSFLQAHAIAGIPTVIAGPHMFFELSHTGATRHERNAFTFLVDPKLAVDYTGTDDVELGLLTLRRWAPLHVSDFHQFCASNKQFLLYGEMEPFAWVARELVKEGWKMTVSAQNGNHFLLLVTSRPE